MPRSSKRYLNNLWIARKEAGLSQKAVARFLGHKSTSVISEYENGRLLPCLRNALLLEMKYKKPLAYLYLPLCRQLQAEIDATGA
jgi:transcriptional regulator with XRE-family HTH domain